LLINNALINLENVTTATLCMRYRTTTFGASSKNQFNIDEFKKKNTTESG